MSNMNPRDDQWLRDVLDNAVADVEPREALHEIRARTRPMTPLRPGRTWMWGAGGAMLATAATVAVIAAIGGSTSPSADDPGLATSPSASASPTADGEPTEKDEPSEAPSKDGAPTPGDDPTGASTPPVGPPASEIVPVYYLGEVTFHQGEGGDMQTAFRLYREWHAVDVSAASAGAVAADAVAEAAVREMLAGNPHDPDYISPWAEGVEVDSVSGAGSVITVDLTGPLQDSSVGAEAAEVAVQQLVYTVQAAYAHALGVPVTDPVRILLDGQPVSDLWGHVDAGEPIARAEQIDVQAPVWVTTPSEGQAVSSPVTVEGVASVFEGTVSWRVLQGTAVVKESSTLASEGGPVFAEFRFTVKLPPGTYTLEAYDASELDGSVTFLDTKTISVK